MDYAVQQALADWEARELGPMLNEYEIALQRALTKVAEDAQRNVHNTLEIDNSFRPDSEEEHGNDWKGITHIGGGHKVEVVAHRVGEGAHTRIYDMAHIFPSGEHIQMEKPSDTKLDMNYSPIKVLSAATNMLAYSLKKHQPHKVVIVGAAEDDKDRLKKARIYHQAISKFADEYGYRMKRLGDTILMKRKKRLLDTPNIYNQSRPTVAGIALRAKDTGRVLMLQRAITENAQSNTWYHGTWDLEPLLASKRLRARSEGIKNRNAAAMGEGVYLTNDIDEAKSYVPTNRPGGVVSVKLKENPSLLRLKNNPRDNKLFEELRREGLENPNRVNEIVSQMGHQGIHWDLADGTQKIVIHSPHHQRHLTDVISVLRSVTKPGTLDRSWEEASPIRNQSSNDPASGKWEFPGGRIEEGETPLEAAKREWSEEVGLPFPSEATMVGQWVGSNGIYQGFVFEIPEEVDIDLKNRDHDSNPDGDHFEACAWIDPDHIYFHNLREEILDDSSRIRPLLSANTLSTNAIEQTKAIVASKYPKATPHVEDIATSHPEQAVEWVAKSLQGGGGRYPEDKQRFQRAWDFYQANKGNPHFQRTSQRFYPQYNPRNPLDYNLHSMEAIQHEMQAPEQKEATKKELSKIAKHEGAEVIHDSPTHKIIQIGGEGKDLGKAAEAACQYGKGTKWCSSNKEIAERYLKRGPLYVFFRKDEHGNHTKIGQAHFSGSHGAQIMDIHDEPISQSVNYHHSEWENLLSNIMDRHSARAAMELNQVSHIIEEPLTHHAKAIAASIAAKKAPNKLTHKEAATQHQLAERELRDLHPEDYEEEDDDAPYFIREARKNHYNAYKYHLP